MELYSRIVLQFFHGLSQQLRGTESFVFGTRLTRVTDAFALRNVDVALDAVSADVVDFAGGTRIAESLHTFRHLWGPKLLRRGAVVLIGGAWLAYLAADAYAGDDARVDDEVWIGLDGALEPVAGVVDQHVDGACLGLHHPDGLAERGLVGQVEPARPFGHQCPSADDGVRPCDLVNAIRRRLRHIRRAIGLAAHVHSPFNSLGSAPHTTPTAANEEYSTTETGPAR